MEVKEEKLTEEQRLREKTIPVFTVLKNGAILKNIFVVNSRDFSSPERIGATVCDDGEEEEILVVGRHPDCDIMLTHPSISRFHLEICSIPSRQKLFVTDLSSVHGTWVTDQKVDPEACIEVNEGDVIRIGGSTRIYRLHWIPLSRAYDIDNPFVSPLDASTAMEQEEENRMLESENLEAAHQSLASSASADDADFHLDVTSEGSGSSVSSEDEDTYITTREISLPRASLSVLPVARDSELKFNKDMQTSTKWDLDVVEAAAEKPSSSCSTPSKQQQSGGYPEGLDCSELEFSAEADEVNIRGDERLFHINVMSEVIESSVPCEDEDPYLAAKETSSLPFPTDLIETETLQLTEDVQVSPELAIDILELNAENQSSGCSRSKGQTSCCFEASDCSTFELAAEVENLILGREIREETEIFTVQVMEISPEPLTNAEIRSYEDKRETEVSRKVIAVSPTCFSETEPILKILTEETQGLIISEFQSEMAVETVSQNTHQKSNGETKVGSRQASEVSDCWQPLPESEVGAPSEIWGGLEPAEYQNQKSGMTRETKKIFDEGSSSCLSEDLRESDTQSLFLTPIQKSKIELQIGSERSEENTDTKSPIPSTLAAETFEDKKTCEDLPCDYTRSQENQTPQTHAVKDDVLSEMDSSSMRLNTCNIWSRRGKSASILQLRTNKINGKQKQIQNQPKAHLHTKQVLNDKSFSLTVNHVEEKLEPEIFTPDKENLTPTTHMLKRLQEIGDIKDSKSSSKLSAKSSSSTIPYSIALTEPEIFTPDKENLTPNSHMLKRLQDVGEIKVTKGSSSKATRKPFFDIHVEQKPDLHSMKSKSKMKNAPVESMKKAERAPFQPLLENSSSQSQSYSDASFTASARNNISRGIRASSILSDAKGKMKWTIVVDTSALLDKDSRKPLNLLQGLKGTHLVVPRTVLRELNETKHSRSLLFRRRTEIASSALDWIEECKINNKWWIQIQSPSEETKATAQTPPVTPQSYGSSSALPFSLQWNINNATEIESPTSQDQVLECALLYRNRNSDEKLLLISNDVTLKIKAMAEGVICETAHEFYESLVNPLSERFMWAESLPRGRTWSHLDDVVLRERKKSTYNGGGGGGRREIGAAAKGLKLILFHNSHYGHIQ